MAEGGRLAESVFAQAERSSLGTYESRHNLSGNPEYASAIADWSRTPGGGLESLPWSRLKKDLPEFCNQLEYYKIPALQEALLCDKLSVPYRDSGVEIALEQAPAPFLYGEVSDYGRNDSWGIIAYGTQWEPTARLTGDVVELSLLNLVPETKESSSSSPSFPLRRDRRKFPRNLVIVLLPVNMNKSVGYSRGGQSSISAEIPITREMKELLLDATLRDKILPRAAAPRFQSYKHAMLAQYITNEFEWDTIRAVLGKNFQTGEEYYKRGKTFNDQTSTLEGTTALLDQLIKDTSSPEVAVDVPSRISRRSTGRTAMPLSDVSSFAVLE